MMTEESFRLHKIHCRGCSDYSNHMGARGMTARMIRPPKAQAQVTTGQNGEFDSPPPPPHTEFTAYGRSVTGLPTMSMLLRKLREQNGLPPEG